MKIVAQARQVNPSVKIRIIQRRLIFQLKRKSKIVLYVRIGQIRNLPLGIRVAKAIIKKNLRSIFSVYFSYQPSVFIDAISVQINNHLHRRIFFQNLFYVITSIIIGLIPIQFSAHHIKSFFYMDHLITIFF